MNKEVQKILEQSMHDIIIASVGNVDITGIFAKQIEKVVESIAHDMFREYGEFGKLLKEKLQKEIEFNINEISVPHFSEIANEIVQVELDRISKEDTEKLTTTIKNKISMFLGKSDDIITNQELGRMFYKEVIKEYMDTSCVCEDSPELDSMSDFSYLFENISNQGSEIEFTLHERSWDASYSDRKYCISHLNMCYTQNKKSTGNKDRYSISLHIHRKRDIENDEPERLYDFWKKGFKNNYQIVGIEINGVYLNSSLSYMNLNNKLEEKLIAIKLNNSLINLDDLSYFEHEQE